MVRTFEKIKQNYKTQILEKWRDLLSELHLQSLGFSKIVQPISSSYSISIGFVFNENTDESK